jgi:antitoxin component of MazEF toxin-antitoxin module
MTPRKASKSGAAPRATKRGTAQFHATLHQAEGKNASGVAIPPEVIEKLGAGKRPPVRVTINGYEYRTTVGVMGGRAMVGVSAAIRKETGLSAGDALDVELAVDDTPRAVDVPADLAKALAAHRGVRAFFDGLANSLQRYHVDNVNAAKTEETRQRRIAKAVELFRAGKKR